MPCGSSYLPWGYFYDMDNYYKGLLVVANIPSVFFLIGAGAKSIETGNPGYFLVVLCFAVILLFVVLAGIFDIFKT